MIEEIKDSISKDFNNLSFDLENWNEVLKDSSDVSVFHLESSIEYYVAYYKGINISFLLYENNTPLAVFPLFAYKDNNQWIMSTNGEGIIGPLFVQETPKKLRKRLEKQIVEILYIISNKLKIEKARFFEPNLILSSWYLLWLENNYKDFLKYQLAIDLRKSIEDIRLGFRKSYKPLVNKALKEWEIEVCDKDNDKIFEEFRLLHLEAAGKETRTRDSWDIQKEQIKNKEAFLVTVRDEGELIGAGFFNYTKDMGMYSVAAYKRELFDRPIGHAVQMLAIEKLKELGCKTYYLGQKATSGISTDKEISISYFKEGFAGHIVAQPNLEVTI
ncbi:MAG: hypothetical protein VX984_01725 [Thermodesulfobacteriota bacterium]|nr:hypothetical protein [Thermodesulfobacteriota bacterium]